MYLQMKPMLATTDDIRYAYRLLLGREPDTISTY